VLRGRGALHVSSFRQRRPLADQGFDRAPSERSREQILKNTSMVSAEAAQGSGTVGDRAERMDAWVPSDASLKEALSTMLQWDAGWVAVLDGARFLGVLTPNTLHAALRRSVGAEAFGVHESEVSVSSSGPVH